MPQEQPLDALVHVRHTRAPPARLPAYHTARLRSITARACAQRDGRAGWDPPPARRADAPAAPRRRSRPRPAAAPIPPAYRIGSPARSTALNELPVAAPSWLLDLTHVDVPALR